MNGYRGPIRSAGIRQRERHRIGEIENVSGGLNAYNVATGFAYAAIGTVATGAAELVAVGGFLVGTGFWLASV